VPNCFGDSNHSGISLSWFHFAGTLQSLNADNPALLWAVETSNVESTNLAMKAIFSFSKDGKVGTMRIDISRPLGAPDIYMRDIKLNVFSGSQTEIPFASAWPDNIALCGASGCGYHEVNAFFKSSACSQVPKAVLVTYKHVLHRIELKDNRIAAPTRQL